ncbi:MAG: hypothetical protein A2743_04440 [Candidatus Taylorbacteria bacterium RIFCSPHIGHO2_01_FULL_43_47]|nr:MAG: hypothetical protein A2743_04440 [Candidatus Taylorbacteria bacterium RIFCSPHIGHO2_01_FULL_43_47]
MKFFVGHIIEGEAGIYHEKITRTISEKFGTAPIHLKLPPHITIVPPFEWQDERQVKEALKDAASDSVGGSFNMAGFDHFSTGTIFVAVVPSLSMQNTFQIINNRFRIFNDYNMRGRNYIPHAAVARFLTGGQFSAIWDFLEDEDPVFRSEFNKVTLFGRMPGGWEILSEEMLR